MQRGLKLKPLLYNPKKKKAVQENKLVLTEYPWTRQKILSKWFHGQSTQPN